MVEEFSLMIDRGSRGLRGGLHGHVLSTRSALVVTETNVQKKNGERRKPTLSSPLANSRDDNIINRFAADVIYCFYPYDAGKSTRFVT